MVLLSPKLLLCAAALLIMLSSCRTIRYVPLPEQHSRDSVQHTSVHRTDSIYIERWHTLIQQGDTILKTDSVFVKEVSEVEVHDTVTIALRDSVPYPVEVPVEVEKPVPRAYRYSLWFVILFVLYWLFRIAKAIYFRK